MQTALSYALLFFVVYSFWSCDESDNSGNLGEFHEQGNELLYPGAPVIDVEAISLVGEIKKNGGYSGVLKYVITSRTPIPYEIDVTVKITTQGLNVFDENSEYLRNEVGSRYEGESKNSHTIEAGRQTFGARYTISSYRKFYKFDWSEPVRISKKLESLSVELLPWPGLGDEPYNLGNAKFTVKP